jgi:hypothetical protein
MGRHGEYRVGERKNPRVTVSRYPRVRELEIEEGRVDDIKRRCEITQC